MTCSYLISGRQCHVVIALATSLARDLKAADKDKVNINFWRTLAFENARLVNKELLWRKSPLLSWSVVVVKMNGNVYIIPNHITGEYRWRDITIAQASSETRSYIAELKQEETGQENEDDPGGDDSEDDEYIEMFRRQFPLSSNTARCELFKWAFQLISSMT
ncbi:predicted protein [Lichtheimia corymbifera JMRC:FSU:9682]|uniref:Uncharacterized protein n=1 Tax=Lichtheimia corymbifera JMRC:FSU:9682 TaxID=1263082 RepID=A0A068RLI9_9FUNG|nr:predicted protein [Lichtheimia corymbifera JMRC:FSU:9682]